jgi:hypothetical protein
MHNFPNTFTDKSVHFINVLDKSAKYIPNLKHKNEFEDWDIHDWKNLYAFKDFNAWIKFIYSFADLAQFYNRMYENRQVFEIYFKSYDFRNINELKTDAGRCVNENWNDIEKLANDGYKFCYFTTQRECYDPNHFLAYMMSNFYYDRGEIGHVTYNNDFVEDENLIPLIANEKW